MKAKNLFKTLSFNTFIPVFYPAIMRPLKSFRKRAIESLDFKKGDKVLLPGVGTGHDLFFLPDNVEAEGIDISDTMLAIADKKLQTFKPGVKAELKKMDAEELEYDDNTFDKAILGLFLTVVFDPKAAFAEVVRVLKPGGEILVFDHLLRSGAMPDLIAKPIDAVLSYSFASVTRSLDDIIEGQPVSITNELPGAFMKAFVLRKD